MDERFQLKYRRLLDMLGDVANCANGKLILVGGTALALFYLKHRISIDLDFVPVQGSETKLKELLKGCLTKKGYRTIAGAYSNQFVVQFEDTSIKIEVFSPPHRLKKSSEFAFGNEKLLVASLGDLLELKLLSYAERKEARDLFDIVGILRKKGESMGLAKNLVERHGKPLNLDELEKLVIDDEGYRAFMGLMKDVT